MKYNFIIFFLLLKLVLFIFCNQSLHAVDKTKLYGFLWKLLALALPPMFESILYFTDTTPGVVIWLQNGWAAFGYSLFQLPALI